MELTIEWQEVNSSCVRRVGYMPEKEMLCVDFIATGLYTYFGIKPDVYKAFMGAPSMGAFVNKVFKQSNWPYQKGIPDAVLFIPEE